MRLGDYFGWLVAIAFALLLCMVCLCVHGCAYRNFGMGPSHNAEDAYERYSLTHTNQ